MNRRMPIAEIIADPKVEEETKRKLKLAVHARQFAETELKLKSTSNYTSYVKLEQKYISYIVSISPKTELKHKLWSFPFVGDVPYKGFFSEQEAQDEAKTFDPNKFDSYVRGASAYSTLGWFDDPILSSMMRYSDHSLVNLIIHETTHATLYIPDNADFNERLATFIGNLGTELYFKKLEGENSKTLKTVADISHDEKIFSEFISKEVDSLKQWYKNYKGKLPEEVRQSRLNEINSRFQKKIIPKTKTKRYHYFAKEKINNALLLSYRTYVYDLSDFRKAFEKNNKNFEKFIAFSKSLEDADDPEKALKKYIANSE